MPTGWKKAVNSRTLMDSFATIDKACNDANMRSQSEHCEYCCEHQVPTEEISSKKREMILTALDSLDCSEYSQEQQAKILRAMKNFLVTGQRSEDFQLINKGEELEVSALSSPEFCYSPHLLHMSRGELLRLCSPSPRSLASLLTCVRRVSHASLTSLSQGCSHVSHTSLTSLSQDSDKSLTSLLTCVSHVSHKSLTRLLQDSDKSLTSLWQVSHMSLNSLSHVFRKSFTCLSKVSQMCLTCLSRVFHKSFKSLLQVSHLSFTSVSLVSLLTMFLQEYITNTHCHYLEQVFGDKTDKALDEWYNII